jgi:hypothetical protein
MDLEWALGSKGILPLKFIAVTMMKQRDDLPKTAT